MLKDDLVENRTIYIKRSLLGLVLEKNQTIKKQYNLILDRMEKNLRKEIMQFKIKLI